MNHQTNAFEESKRQLHNFNLELLQIIDDENICLRITKANHRLFQEKMNILIVGEFSRGKSTFINAILGQPVLPSKVNPTTATINVIAFGKEKKMTIHYRNNKSEEVSLPQEKINKFLDSYVTTLNKKANKINYININWPNLIGSSDCVIVDTPGVNDLDETREEITYGYLGNADACIIILDSQQPLSASERNFIKYKVLGHDVYKLFFVVNRMDEVSDDQDNPDVETINRITNYVKKLITDNFDDFKDIKVYGVSSKQTLASRFRDNNGVWDNYFKQFENELINFISENANLKRMPAHFIRTENILKSTIDIYEKQLDLIGLTGAELDEKIRTMTTEEKHLSSKLETVEALFSKQRRQFIDKIYTTVSNNLTKMKNELIQYSKSCTTNDELNILKIKTSESLRSIIEQNENIINEYKNKIISDFKDHFSDLIDKGIKTEDITENIDRDVGIIEFDSFSDYAEENWDENRLALSVAGGMSVGYLAASLFSGPVGIIAGICTTVLIKEKISQNQNQSNHSLEREKTLLRISKQMDDLISTTKRVSKTNAEKEAKKIENLLRLSIKGRIESIHTALNHQKNNVLLQADDINRHKIKLNDKIEFIQSSLHHLNELRSG